MNIYQGNTYRKKFKLDTLRRTVKVSREAASEGHDLYVPAFAAYLTFQIL